MSTAREAAWPNAELLCHLRDFPPLSSNFLLMALAGLGWLAFLFPVVAHGFSMAIEALGIVVEAALMLWLLVMGVNVQRSKATGLAL